MRRVSASHCGQRAKERYGIEATPKVLGQLRADIIAGKGVVMKKWPDGRQKMLVQCGGQTAVIIWSTVKQIIVTFLPPEAATARGAKKHRRDKRRNLDELARAP